MCLPKKAPPAVAIVGPGASSKASPAIADLSLAPLRPDNPAVDASDRILEKFQRSVKLL